MGRRALVFMSVTAVLGMAGCRQHGGEGSRCDSRKDCAHGLTCSASGTCYRPLDCDRLAARFLACGEAFEQITMSPLDAPGKKAGRTKEISTKSRAFGEALARDLGMLCRLDWADHFAETSSTLAVARSRGQDPQARRWRRCLAEPSCDDFAHCALELARWPILQDILPPGFPWSRR